METAANDEQFSRDPLPIVQRLAPAAKVRLERLVHPERERSERILTEPGTDSDVNEEQP
jgi:hypothetical protein